MVTIKRLNHASFRIKGSKRTIYIDPYEINSKCKADIILITHPHFDHFSPQDINSIKDKNSILVAPCSRLCPGLKLDVYTMRPYESLKLDDIKIHAVPSYNINKHYHPKANGWLGYIIEIDGKRIYHAGDTDLISEMNEITDIDYALLPISGKYTMNPEEAAKAASIIKPKVAIPMHYGAIFGDYCNVDLFKSMCNCKVDVL